MFSTSPKANFYFGVTFMLSSANAFILGMSKILSFGKEFSDSLDLSVKKHETL